jgi:hypothetical protein
MSETEPSNYELLMAVRQLREETADLRAQLEASTSACQHAREKAQILRRESRRLREYLQQQRQQAV